MTASLIDFRLIGIIQSDRKHEQATALLLIECSHCGITIENTSPRGSLYTTKQEQIMACLIYKVNKCKNKQDQKDLLNLPCFI